MGTYNIPRNTKGEGRLFYIFSTKALIYTVAGIIIGAAIRWILETIGNLLGVKGSIFSTIGIVIMALLALFGFVIATFKVPHIDKFEITRKAAGNNIDKVIFESIKFRLNRKKLYIYDTDELIRDSIKSELKEEQEQKEKEEKLWNDITERQNRNRRGYIK